MSIEHTYPTQIIPIFHHCQHGGIPQSLESDEIRWVNSSDLDKSQFPAANMATIDTTG